MELKDVNTKVLQYVKHKLASCQYTLEKLLLWKHAEAEGFDKF